MSDPIPELKPMPLASVIYVATFHDGLPTVQAKIHGDEAGRIQFTGDPAKAYGLLKAALEKCEERFATTQLTEQLKRAFAEKAALQQELNAAPTTETDSF